MHDRDPVRSRAIRRREHRVDLRVGQGLLAPDLAYAALGDVGAHQALTHFRGEFRAGHRDPARLVRQRPAAHTIKRLLRWRGDLSLEIYARLNDDEWASHVKSIYTASVDSTVAGRLATLGTIDLEAAALRIGAAA